MRHQCPLIVLLATALYTNLAASYLTNFQYPDENYDDELLSEMREDNAPRTLVSNELNVEKLENAMNVLRKILILPWPNGEAPIFYLEGRTPLHPEDYIRGQRNDIGDVGSMPEKRTRYYRKYPWKRQNVKYDPDSRFVCMPTKDEVHRLLVALHKSRYGNKNLSVDFCNRKRPAYSVFTNIHYLGK